MRKTIRASLSIFYLCLLVAILFAVGAVTVKAQTGSGSKIVVKTTFDGQHISGPFDINSLPFSFNYSFNVPSQSIAAGQTQVVQDAWNNLAVYLKNGTNLAGEPVDKFFSQAQQPPLPPGLVSAGASFSVVIDFCPGPLVLLSELLTNCQKHAAVKSSALFNPTTSSSPDILNLVFVFDNTYNLTQRTISVLDPETIRAFVYSTSDGFSDLNHPTRIGYNEDINVLTSTIRDPTAHVAEYDTTANRTELCRGVLQVSAEIQPARMPGAPTGSPLWFVSALPTGDNKITMIRANPPAGTDCFYGSTTFSLTVPTYSAPPLITQNIGAPTMLKLGSGATIQGAFWHNNRLEVIHTVGSAADNFATAHVRVYDIDTSTNPPMLKATYEIAPEPGVNTYAGALAINAADEVGLIYMESSPAEFPSIYVTGKNINDPNFAPGVLAKAGPFYLENGNPTLVDDSSGISVDPADGSFWATGEWGPAGMFPNGATTIVNFSVTTPGADVSVTKTAPSTVVAGTDLSYAITVSNAGPLDASNVTLTDPIPAGTTFVSFAQTSGPSFTTGNQGGAATANIASLAVGASATFTLVVHVSSNAAAGLLGNTATVSSSTTDPVTSNNSSTANTTVTPVTLVSIAVTPTNPSITKGGMRQFTATGTFSDNSTQVLTNVVWASATTAVATINATGLATGVGTGTSIISATSGGITGWTVLTVTPTSTCATDFSSQNAITRSGYAYNFTTQRFLQTVTLTNIGNTSVQGPISLVLDGLSSNASLSNASGWTACAAPLGSPFINLAGPLNPGAKVSVVLQFTDPTKAGITYQPRVLAASGSR